MKFNIEDVLITPVSLGLFGTGEKYTVKHKPSGITIQMENHNRRLTHDEKLEMLEQLKKKVEGSPMTFDVLDIPKPKKQEKSFAQISMEDKIRSMSRMYKLAKCVLKEDKIIDWMKTPHEMLKGKTPFEACLTDEGYDRVEDILAGVAYGFPS